MNDYGWTEEDEMKLRRFRAQNTLLYTEIAEKLGRSVQSVRWKAKTLGLPSTQKTLSHRLGAWNAKHKHLRLPALRYYQAHTAKETAKRFGLTDREFKSLITVTYKTAAWKKLRKETRTHEPWSAKELKFLLRHAGLVPRKKIMEKIGRGKNVCHIKERLQTLGVASRTIQGITLSQYINAFGERPRFFLKTSAGPDGGAKGTLPTRWKLVPWVWLDQELKAKRLKTAPEFRMLVSSMAMFQDWIFEGNALRKMKRICKESERGAIE